MQRWTEEEVLILKDHYATLSREDLCRALPDRTWATIKTNAHTLKLSMSYKKGSHEERFWKYVDKKSDGECWNWAGCCDKDGYGRFGVKYKIIRAHRFSWILHNEDIPDNICVLHKCDNPTCINPSHLFLGTPKDNSDDMKNKHRQSKLQGEDNHNHKLNLNQVKEIRKLCCEGKLTQKKIAKTFNVSHQLISKIYTSKIWN